MNHKTIYFISLIGALGGLLFGLDQGFIANSLKTISFVYDLTISEGEKYSATLAWGGILGALLSGLFARFFGRKKVLIIAGFIFMIMSLISACLPSFLALCLCRFGLGFSVGIASFNVPLYLAETSPTNIRGSLTTLFQLMIAVGVFFISLTNVFIVSVMGNSEISITLMFLVIVFFSGMMFIGSFFLPESPRWLILKGQELKALSVLNNIRKNKKEASQEISEIKNSINSQNVTSLPVRKIIFWKILFVGILLQAFQQLVGINMIIYYAPTIFDYARITGVLSLLIVPFFFMIFTFPAVKWIEKWGRKKLLFIGSIIMMCSMLSSGFSFLYIECYLAKLILVISSVIYIFGFSCSWGPVVWVLCSEIFPIKKREIGITITTMVNWLFAGVVMANALSFMELYGNASIFFVFAAFCLLSLFFLKLFVPETKNISLENIEKNFS